MTKSRHLYRPRWQPTPADIELVRQQFATSKTADLAAVLGVEYHRVSRLAARLGLKKDEAFLSGPAGGRLDGIKGAGTRFQKGLTPHNKGKKGGPCVSPQTAWKVGQRPMNWQPIGSLRIARMGKSDGYLQIKLTDTGYPPRDWVMYHRHVWEQAHGPVPPGHVVVFKGERTTEPERITPDALELITRRQLMARNTYHQYGPEIAHVVQLRGAITRQINKRAAQQAEQA